MLKAVYQVILLSQFCSGALAAGADTPSEFLGASSCASSSCHGGGGEKQNQFLVWSLRDFHSQRPPATLTSARSKQIAESESLRIQDPTKDVRCTSCHAPLASVPENQRGEHFNLSEGVSCESCHGMAQNWIRSHTRKDYTRADRVAAGMNDLQSLYVRANVCVACHQVVSGPLLAAGHPELIFELDGQSVAEPKHWSPGKNGNPAQAWFVGQAVALREMSWKLTKEAGTERELKRWLGLFWIVERASHQPQCPPAPVLTDPPTADNFSAVKNWADRLALTSSQTTWSNELSVIVLNSLASSSADFLQTIAPETLARRAERLVLALDRLVAAENQHQADADLDQLFKLAQSVPDFEPKTFADALSKFSQSLAKAADTKPKGSG